MKPTETLDKTLHRCHDTLRQFHGKILDDSTCHTLSFCLKRDLSSVVRLPYETVLKTIETFRGLTVNDEIARDIAYLISGNLQQLKSQPVRGCKYFGAAYDSSALCVFTEFRDKNMGLRVITGPHAGDLIFVPMPKERASRIAYQIGMQVSEHQRLRNSPIFRYIGDLIGHFARVEIQRLNGTCRVLRIFGDKKVRQMNKQGDVCCK